MTKYELRLGTRIGDLTIHFDTMSELEERLKELGLEEVLTKPRPFEVTGTRQQRQPKTSLQDLYRFTPDDYVELLKTPRKKVETIGLVLFAYDPIAATVQQIARSSGVKNAADYLLNKAYTKYFTKNTDGTYSLSQTGKVWISEGIVPKLRIAPARTKES
jgi:hypothetical protein